MDRPVGEYINELIATARATFRVWLFGISQGHSIGVPNSLGVWRGKPQQVEDSSLLFMPIPKDPRVFKRAQRLMRFQQLREVAGDMPEDEALALAQVVAEDVRHWRFL